MRIIRQRERIESTFYTLFFERKAIPGSGYVFDCDSEGVVDESKFAPILRENYAKCCKLSESEFLPPVVRIREDYFIQVAIGECNGCSAPVELHGFTNTCDGCGRDYNMSGQELAPRSQWGEETGESLGDILRIR